MSVRVHFNQAIISGLRVSFSTTKKFGCRINGVRVNFRIKEV